MRSLIAMETDSLVVAKPGLLLRGTSILGVVTWFGVLVLCLALPGVTFQACLSALGMLALFGALLAGQAMAQIRVRPDGLFGRTLFRRMHCNWSAVQRVEVRPFFPGLTIFLVATSRGPLVFTSLWRNYRELLATLRERAQLA